MASAGSVPSGKKQGEGEEQSSSPGELVLKKLFAQFVVTTEAKLKFVASQPLVSLLIPPSYITEYNVMIYLQ